MRDIFEDLSLVPGITRDDVELAGPVALAPMVEWRRHAEAGLVVVGTSWEMVFEWDPEEGVHWMDERVLEAWVDAEALREARRLRTWWDMAARVGFDDWA